MVLIIDGNSEIGAHGKEQSLLFDLLKEFDQIESSQKLDFWGLYAVPNKQTKPGFFFSKGPIFLHSCATCSELPSNISPMG